MIEDKCECGASIPRGYGYYLYEKEVKCYSCGRKNKRSKAESIREFSRRFEKCRHM